MVGQRRARMSRKAEMDVSSFFYGTGDMAGGCGWVDEVRWLELEGMR